MQEMICRCIHYIVILITVFIFLWKLIVLLENGENNISVE